MNAEKETKVPAKPTGRRYGSVAELLRVEGISKVAREKDRGIPKNSALAQL